MTELKRISVERITRPSMAERGFHRYSVTINGVFVGEVFQHMPIVNSHPLWLVQSSDGVIYYGHDQRRSFFKSRKAAIAVLVMLHDGWSR